jgi:Icc-related predicted phosphoesterase
MKIQVLSDLHLESAQFAPSVVPDVDVVVLAGDIAPGLRGMRWARETFSGQKIVYVAGNHEFYDHQLDALSLQLRDAAKDLSVFFLERSSVEIDGIRFLGTTLWTDFELFGSARSEESKSTASLYMLDFSCIKVTRGLSPALLPHSSNFTPSDAKREFDLSAAWLDAELASGDPSRTIVVTHHAPHMLSVEPRFGSDLLSSAFASDLTRLLGRSKFWIHGHMHGSSRYNVNGTEVVSNPRGYRRRDGAMENGAFDPNLIIEI